MTTNQIKKLVEKIMNEKVVIRDLIKDLSLEDKTKVAHLLNMEASKRYIFKNYNYRGLEDDQLH